MIEDQKSIESKRDLATWIPQAEGWLTVPRAQEMYDLIRTVQPDIVVEIGVFGGKSLVSQAMGIRDNGKGMIIGIDPWKNDVAVSELTDARAADWWKNVDLHKIHQGCMEAIWRFSLDKYVTIIRSTSSQCVSLIPKLDIIYIDGGHSEEFSCTDVSLYLPKVKKNGWIWFDDCDWETTKKAQRMLDEQCSIARDNHTYKLYCKKSDPV